MLKVTGFYEIIDEVIEVEYVIIDQPESLVLYMIRISIGVKSYENILYSRD